jgi:hydroxymethylbilane synthase
VADALRRVHPGLEIELVAIHTSGDRLATAHLATLGGKGLFVREIEEALRDGRLELAVHSLKDLPADLPRGLTLAAFPERDDPRDALVSRHAGALAGVPRGGRVGTSSLRRRVQLLWQRPDLAVEAIRGNVETRLRKLAEVPYDAVVLAAAGLRRLGLDPAGTSLLDPADMLPAVGQGVLAVETRDDDDSTRKLVAPIDHPATRAAAGAERAFLETIGGSCTTPLGAYARPQPDGFRLDAFVASSDGTRLLRGAEIGDPARPADLGRRVAERMLAAGAGDLVRAGHLA